jgi:hypothetical protein
MPLSSGVATTLAVPQGPALVGALSRNSRVRNEKRAGTVSQPVLERAAAQLARDGVRSR